LAERGGQGVSGVTPERRGRDRLPASRNHSRPGILTFLILLAALFVSPLGYLLIGPLGALTDKAAGSLF